MQASVGANPTMRIQKPQPKGALHRRRVREFTLFILPWIIGFIAFEAFPLLQSLWISFASLQFQAKGVQFLWVGLANYQHVLFVDPNFVGYLVQAIVSTVIELPMILTFALTSAVLMKQGLFGTTFFRGLFFLPVVVGSSAVMSQVFQAGGVPVIIDGAWLGPIFHAVGPAIAKDILYVFQGMALVLWRSGVQVLLFLAGLYGVPPTYYEVARIDGASPWQTFLKVTLPCLSPVILLVAIYTLVDSFTNPLLNPVLGYIQSIGLGGSLELGWAGAMGWMYFLLVFLVLVVMFRYSRHHVYYAGEK